MFSQLSFSDFFIFELSYPGLSFFRFSLSRIVLFQIFSFPELNSQIILFSELQFSYFSCSELFCFIRSSCSRSFPPRTAFVLFTFSSFSFFRCFLFRIAHFQIFICFSNCPFPELPFQTWHNSDTPFQDCSFSELPFQKYHFQILLLRIVLVSFSLFRVVLFFIFVLSIVFFSRCSLFVFYFFQLYFLEVSFFKCSISEVSTIKGFLFGFVILQIPLFITDPFQIVPFSELSFLYLSFSICVYFKASLFRIGIFQVFPFQICPFS